MKLRTLYRHIYERLSNRINLLRMQRESLLKYAANTYSQMGEDGIIDHIFRRLNVRKGFFVEFGAWDGIHLSNARRLVEQGWEGVFIEADPARFSALQRNYQGCPRVLCLNEYVTHDAKSGRGMTFDAIADTYFPHKPITFLSIDIDGMDYRIFESIQRKAILAVVEGGAVWSPHFNRQVPDDISRHDLQQPLGVMCALGKSKGYAPVCFNFNTFFIDERLRHHFRGIRNDPEALWKDYWYHLDFYSRVHCADGHKREPVRQLEGEGLTNITFEHFLFDKLGLT